MPISDVMFMSVLCIESDRSDAARAGAGAGVGAGAGAFAADGAGAFVDAGGAPTIPSSHSMTRREAGPSGLVLGRVPGTAMKRGEDGKRGEAEREYAASESVISSFAAVSGLWMLGARAIGDTPPIPICATDGVCDRLA